MKKYLIVGLLLSATVSAGCGQHEIARHESTEAPDESFKSDEYIASETLNRMLEVAKKGNWVAYVDDYYGEHGKFRSPADRDALVQRFEKKWGESVVQGLARAAKLPTQIDGDKAIFLDGEDTVFMLHRSESGDWKFHL